MEELYRSLNTRVSQDYKYASKAHVIPVLPEAQCIVLPVVREVIAPIVIRNNDADMVTDIEAAGAVRVRMIASKTKGVERRRGSQILRSLGIGGNTATNKAYIPKGAKAGDIFDLNTFVFGDAAKGGEKAIYPVHAAVLYSDAISVQAASERLDSVFRQGGIADEGVSFNSERQETSSNIFTTRSVVSGTLFVQTIVMLGRRMTQEAFDHLLLSMGIAGAYGGSTATTGTNLRTHLCGAYWGTFERAINAPQELIGEICKDVPLGKKEVTAGAIVNTISECMKREYPNALEPSVLNEYVSGLVNRFENSEQGLVGAYKRASVQMKDLYNAWFTGDKQGKKDKKASEAVD